MKSQESRNLVPKVFPPRFSSFLYKNNLYKIYFKKLAGGGGLLGYDFGGYVPPGFQNLDSVLKKLFLFRNRAIFNTPLCKFNVIERFVKGRYWAPVTGQSMIRAD